MQHIAVSSEQSVQSRRKAAGSELVSADEALLVERAQRDPREFAVLYDRHFQQIYRFAYSRVRDQGIAEDVTSEVFMKALVAMPRYRYDGRPFAAWLYRIASNVIIDRSRVHWRSEPSEDVAGDVTNLPTEDLVLHRDEISRIWGLVEGLPTEQRTAMVLRFKGEMRVREIATAMGKSNGSVKLLIHRAVGRLRAEAPALRPAI
ncbi:MAG TPA: RNA polymerase sigma factor [Candidatus Dormibacteraeota bacterium]|jgi:RNA polymerase sigma-70 factor (ECF subfamily)